MTTEAAFRDWVRGRWPGWVDGREPRMRGSRAGWGSGNGAPDMTLGVPWRLQMIVPSGVMLSPRPVIPLPVELKLAGITHGTKLVAANGAPGKSQRDWHVAAHVRGVLTAFMWGVPAGLGWRAFIVGADAGLRGWCELSGAEAAELPGDEKAFYQAVGDWARERWGR